MKKILTILLLFISLFTFCSCDQLLTSLGEIQTGGGEEEEESVITITSKLPSYFEVTDKAVDFTKYFTIHDSLKGNIEVLEEYIDASLVNLKVAGTYILKLSYLTKSKTYTIIVKGTTVVTPDVQLSTPTISNVTSNYLDITITYTKVSNCSSYLFTIYDENNTSIGTFTTNGGEAKYTFTYAGSYKVTCVAKATTTGFIDSKTSTAYSFTVSKKPDGGDTYTPSRDTTYTTRLQNKMAADSNYFGVGVPSLGTPTILVIPVDFSDTTYTTAQINNIKTAFTGTAADTGYQSLNSYYKLSSYGQLDIQVDFLDTYKCSKTKSKFKSGYNSSYDETDLLADILDYYDSKVDFSKYDYNKDGDIDGVYMIYNNKPDYENDSCWWAWCAWMKAYNIYEQHDGVYANYYNWTAYYFLMESVPTTSSSKYDYKSDPAITGLKVNALTIIHESGHMLCLDDYYDYSSDKGVNGGLGGFDMMDYNEGDHCAYSKIMMGWVNPYIVTQSCSVTLGKFNSTGDCIVIPKNASNPYFGEYITIEYFTPDGVNDWDGNYVFTTNGVKIMQVDSTLPTSYSSNQFSFTKYDNSEAAHALIRYIEPDGKFQIQKSNSSTSYDASNDTLFQANDTFNPGQTGNFSSLKWYDSTAMKFTITISNMTSTSVTINITYR